MRAEARTVRHRSIARRVMGRLARLGVGSALCAWVLLSSAVLLPAGTSGAAPAQDAPPTTAQDAQKGIAQNTPEARPATPLTPPTPAPTPAPATPNAAPADGSGETSAKTGDAKFAPAQGETVDQALCRLIDAAAKANGLPASFFTRLIWRESSFRHDVVSHKGAQGIAQFMPGTARERGLANPFDPEAAIPASAKLLADLQRQFGNLGLAAAAYNAGPGRVNGFLTSGSLPAETRAYVLFITGRDAQDWARLKASGEPAPAFPAEECGVTVAALRKGARAPGAQAMPAPELFAPWGVQISGNYSREIALASYQREAAKSKGAFGNARPMIISTKVGGRGSKVFYRVRIPAQTKEAAMKICDRLRKGGGACLVLPN